MAWQRQTDRNRSGPPSQLVLGILVRRSMLKSAHPVRKIMLTNGKKAYANKTLKPVCMEARAVGKCRLNWLNAKYQFDQPTTKLIDSV